MSAATQAGAGRPRRRLTIHQQLLFALLGVNALVMFFIGALFYAEQKTALFSEMDARLTAVATLAREMLPPDYHDRITGPESVSDAEFQKIVDRNNQLCKRLGIEYLWSLLLVDGKVVFTTSTSPDKVAANRQQAMFFEAHPNPEQYTTTFATMRATFQTNVDKWGNVRVALVPFRDAKGRKYLFCSGEHMTEVSRQLREVLWQAFALGCVGFMFSTAVGLWVVRRVTRPISRLTDTIRAIAAGRGDVKAEESGSVEMITLARHFNRLNRAFQEKISDLEASRISLIDQRDSDRRQAEEMWTMSEQRYRGLLDFAVDGILVGKPDGVIIEANERMCELFCLARTEMVGKHISHMPFTSKSLAENPLRFDLLDKGEKVVTERTIRRKDGSEVIVEMHSKKLPDGTLQSFYRDITGRKRAEQELMRSEQRYKNLLNFAVDGILVCDNAGAICDANERLCAICGLDQADLIGRNIRDLPFTPESLARAPIRIDLVQKGETVASERAVRRRDGSEVVVEMRTKKMPDGVHQSIWNDVTRRKQEELALQETRRMLEEAQRLAKMGAWKIEIATHQVTWTDEVYRIHGVERDYPIDRTIDDLGFAAPEYRQTVNEAFCGAIEQGLPFDIEVEIVRTDGQRVWVRSSGRPIFQDGKVVRVDGQLMDITEAKQAEDKLLRSQRELSRQNEVLNTLLQNLSVGVVMVDAESAVPLVANNAAQQLIGVTAAQDKDLYRHLNDYSFFSGADRKRLSLDQLPLARARRGERTPGEEISVVRPDGRELTLEIFATPVKNEDGSIWAALGSFVDISDRKRTEIALQESETRYRQLFEMESDAILLTDFESGRFLDANLAAQTLYGYSRAEMLAKGPEDIVDDPAQARTIIRNCAYAGKHIVLVDELLHKNKDGRVFPVEITARFYTMNGRLVFVSAIRDITERKRARELLETWNAALEKRVAERTAEVEKYTHQLQALTGRLIRTEEEERQRITDVLHEDLQQILVASRMTLGVVLQTVKGSAMKKSLEAVDDMLAQSVRLTRSLVLDIAVPALREGEIPFAVAWLCQQMKEKFNLTADLVIAEDIKPVSENVYLCLYRAIQELLFNVVKHAQVGLAEIAVRNADRGRYVQVVVKDRGRGFSVGAMEQAERANKGFGLFSIRERLEGLGGRMEIDSEVGRGTTIVLTVPLRG